MRGNGEALLGFQSASRKNEPKNPGKWLKGLERRSRIRFFSFSMDGISAVGRCSPTDSGPPEPADQGDPEQQDPSGLSLFRVPYPHPALVRARSHPAPSRGVGRGGGFLLFLPFQQHFVVLGGLRTARGTRWMEATTKPTRTGAWRCSWLGRRTRESTPAWPPTSWGKLRPRSAWRSKVGARRGQNLGLSGICSRNS